MLRMLSSIDTITLAVTDLLLCFPFRLLPVLLYNNNNGLFSLLNANPGRVPGTV